jgi:hypothetical protein
MFQYLNDFGLHISSASAPYTLIPLLLSPKKSRVHLPAAARRKMNVVPFQPRRQQASTY